MAQAKAVGADRVELYTETYAAAWGTPEHGAQLQSYAVAARAALDVGLGLNAGHDLNQGNLPLVDPNPVAAGGADVIIELVGAPNFPANIKALALRGRIVIVGVGLIVRKRKTAARRCDLG